MKINIEFNTDSLEDIKRVRDILSVFDRVAPLPLPAHNTNGINVLSLFNGMSCGMMALESSGISVGKYYSSEIDKYANIATGILYPEIVQMGDVTKWREWGNKEHGFDMSEIDLLIAGFPCQAWSMAGNQGGDDDPRGALVHDLIAIWEAINKSRLECGKSEVKFMFENVKMKKEFLHFINNLFKVEPININSSLVSAQNRERCYWTNIKGVEQPEDKNLCINDIWGGGIDITDRFNLKREGTLAFSKSRSSVRTLRDKSKCLTAGGQNISNSGATNVKIGDRYYMPSVRESMRLQTVPGWCIDKLLSSDISNTQLNKMAGNGWTVDVIEHIFRSSGLTGNKNRTLKFDECLLG